MDPSRKRRLLKNLIGLLLAPVLLFFFLRWFEYRSVFQPSRSLDTTGEELGRPREVVWLQTADQVQLNAWYFPGRKDSKWSGHAFLIAHGNAGNISHRLDLYEVLLSTGAAVFAFDYRGYGLSEGKPSEQGTYRDAEAAYDWLAKNGYPPENIFLFGESLGGGVVAELAVRKQVGGLILQSTYSSVEKLGKELYPFLPVKTVGKIKFNTIKKVPQVDSPVMVMHGRQDAIIPFSHGERIYAAANSPKALHEIAGGHNDTLITDRETFRQGIEAFLAMVGKNQ